MAEVWKGRHARQDVAVALRVMSLQVSKEQAWRAAFSDEIRAVARLYHPGIVLIFDHGIVSEEAAEASSGRMLAGNPWLAMELAGHGT